MHDTQMYEHLFAKVVCTTNGVIPVLDTGIQFLLPGVKLSFLDSSIKHWNDTIIK
ncbi:hypothetical protein HCR16_04265 [Wolbachia pipientis]|uniref:hypothetical protein n=1 Tax=Wolbachia pipientis TaxID=955 RepID=UPI0015FD40AF|nr:hypothetical protein [Wolbachia pipientis]MBA8770314.1 hypothetical protein [Wolbachia pipientis]